MFVSTYDETRARARNKNNDTEDGSSTTDSDIFPQPPTPTGPIVHDISDRPPIAELTGAWSALADEAALATQQALEEIKLHGKSLPIGFKGVATPDLNPMVCSRNVSSNRQFT